MINQINGKPKPGFGFVIGILTLIMLLGLVGELHPARAMNLQSGERPDAIDDKYFYLATDPLTVSAPGVLTNDTDPETDPLSAVTATNAPTAFGGTYTLYADGSFTYTKPSTDFIGGDFFYYRVYDGTGYSTLARVSLQPLSAQNVPPALGEGVGTCMDADCTISDSWNCTASNNEVRSIEIANVQDVCTDPICNPITNECIPDTGIYDFKVTVDPNAGTLYDMGLWVQVETEPGQTVVEADNAIYGNNCYKGYYHPVSDTAPWFNEPETGGPFKDLDGDICGDVESSDPATSYVMTDVSVVCTELLMEGYISAVATWQGPGKNEDCAAVGYGVCPSEIPKCAAAVIPFEVSKKDVDLALTKTNVGLDPGFIPEPGQYIDYTIRIDNLPYDDPDIAGTTEYCYRSSGYVIEDELPSYLKAISVTSAVTQSGTDLTASVKCVNASGVTIPCDYGTLYQIKVDNNLPTISTPEPNINDPIDAATCAAQWHTITLRVQYDDSDPRDIAPTSIYNYACVNGFQYDPWGGAKQAVDPITGEITVVDAYGNNCDFDNVITEVELLSFSAEDKTNHIFVEWETASERDNLGFNLYRSTSFHGERVKLNSSLIPSTSPGEMLGSSYTYLDDYEIQRATIYYYWLEDVDLFGKTTINGPASTRTKYLFWVNAIYLPSIMLSH